MKAQGNMNHTDKDRGRRALMAACRKAGGQAALGRVINRSQSTVWEWLGSGLVHDIEAVLAIEKATGISRHQLRPDLSAAFAVGRSL
jgi:DNA-binding transcriptional regulator YdaS (Cro superfamily)